MAPDLIVVPVIRLPLEEDPAGVLARMIPIATEYASRMDRGWEAQMPGRRPVATIWAVLRDERSGKWHRRKSEE